MKFVKVPKEKFKCTLRHYSLAFSDSSTLIKAFAAIEIVELTDHRPAKSHRLLLPMLKHSFSEHTMDFQNDSSVARTIFPKRKFPTVLDHAYHKLDFSAMLNTMSHQRRDKDISVQRKAEDDIVVDIDIQREPAFIPLSPSAVMVTEDQPHDFVSEFKSDFVAPIIDSLIIKTIATVHDEPNES